MTDLVFPGDAFRSLSEALLTGPDENCAILYATRTNGPREGVRLLIQDIEQPTSSDYRVRNPVAAELTPAFVALAAKRAKAGGRAVVFVHSHPGSSSAPDFSVIDDGGERPLAAFLDRRGLPGPHAALVLSPGGCRARRLGTREPVRVVRAGDTLEVLFGGTATNDQATAFDRQVRAFGAAGQATLKSLQVGVVGLGGTGSIVAQQLAYLGVGDLLLIDPDAVDETSLNRLVGAAPGDIGTDKVEVAARRIRAVHPGVNVIPLAGSVLDESTALLLAETDFFFCCTDSHGSRAVLNQLAYQYLVPAIDMGVSISTRAGQVTHIAGRVQMLAPGLGCLTCAGLLDSAAVRRDLMSRADRQADPYFVGAGEPQPAVISLNGTVASLAVTMFLAAVTGIPARARYQIYNGVSGAVRPATQLPTPGCVVCSATGALARGGSWPLAARRA